MNTFDKKLEGKDVEFKTHYTNETLFTKEDVQKAKQGALDKAHSDINNIEVNGSFLPKEITDKMHDILYKRFGRME